MSTEAERIAKGHQARRALEEFLDPAFDALITTYTDRIEDISSREPWAADKIVAVAQAVRIAKEVHGQIVALVYDGKHAQSEVLRVEKIEALSPARRRLAAIGG